VVHDSCAWKIDFPWQRCSCRTGYPLKWIRREKVKVDRVACPWLIKKFIDPEAEFVFPPGAHRLVRDHRGQRL
jgi:hypothetical protein